MDIIGTTHKKQLPGNPLPRRLAIGDLFRAQVRYKTNKLGISRHADMIFNVFSKSRTTQSIMNNKKFTEKQKLERLQLVSDIFVDALAEGKAFGLNRVHYSLCLQFIDKQIDDTGKIPLTNYSKILFEFGKKYTALHLDDVESSSFHWVINDLFSDKESIASPQFSGGSPKKIPKTFKVTETALENMANATFEIRETAQKTGWNKYGLDVPNVGTHDIYGFIAELFKPFPADLMEDKYKFRLALNEILGLIRANEEGDVIRLISTALAKMIKSNPELKAEDIKPMTASFLNLKDNLNNIEWGKSMYGKIKLRVLLEIIHFLTLISENPRLTPKINNNTLQRYIGLSLSFVDTRMKSKIPADKILRAFTNLGKIINSLNTQIDEDILKCFMDLARRPEYQVDSSTVLFPDADDIYRNQTNKTLHFIQSIPRDICSKEDIINIFGCSGKSGYDDLVTTINRFAILTKEFKMKVLLEKKDLTLSALKNKVDALLDAKLKDDTALAGIIKFAEQNNLEISGYILKFIQNCGITDEKIKIKLLKLAAAEDGGRISQAIMSFGIKDETTLIEIAKIVAAQDGLAISEHIRNYGIKDKKALAEIFKMALLNDINALMFLPDYFSDSIMIVHEELDRCGKEDIAEYIKPLLDKKGINPDLADYIYSDMGNRDAGIKLIPRLLQETKDGLLQIPDPERNFARYLLGRTVGIDPLLLYKPEKLNGEFYELFLLLQEGTDEEIFNDIKIDPCMFEKGNINILKEFLYAIARFKTISGTKPPDIAPEITAGNIKTETDRIDNMFMEIFNRKFKIRNHKITIDSIRKLEAQWGDLNVLYTLFGRYEGNSSWQGELPVLSRIAENVLNGTFVKYKYEGDPKDPKDTEYAVNQLSPLRTDEHKKAWRDNYQAISIFNTVNQSAQKSEQELLERSKKVLIEQAMHHITEWLVNQVNTTMLEKLIKENPKHETIIKYDKKDTISACITLLRSANDFGEYHRILSFFRSEQDFLGLNLQVRSDLKTASNALKYSDTGNEAIVFTTTTDDPKLLLMTGDLVNASSCQNYRTGGYVQTLPGYVIDANVKLVLSYAIQPRHCKNSAEYEKVKTMIQGGTKPEYIAATQKLKIGDIEIALPKATKRRVIKLGETEDKQPGIVLETEYFQNHFAESMMEGQLMDVTKEMAGKCGASLGKKIIIPGTRNPLGIYSDKGAGIETWTYEIGGEIEK